MINALHDPTLSFSSPSTFDLGSSMSVDDSDKRIELLEKEVRRLTMKSDLLDHENQHLRQSVLLESLNSPTTPPQSRKMSGEDGEKEDVFDLTIEERSGTSNTPSPFKNTPRSMKKRPVSLPRGGLPQYASARFKVDALLSADNDLDDSSDEED